MEIDYDWGQLEPINEDKGKGEPNLSLKASSGNLIDRKSDVKVKFDRASKLLRRTAAQKRASKKVARMSAIHESTTSWI
jgi:hypothetical protein